MVLCSWPQRQLLLHQQQQQEQPVDAPNGLYNFNTKNNDLIHSQYHYCEQQQPQQTDNEHYDYEYDNDYDYDDQYEYWNSSSTTPSSVASPSSPTSDAASTTTGYFSETTNSLIENLSSPCSSHNDESLGSAVSLSQQLCCSQTSDRTLPQTQTPTQTLAPAPHIELFDVPYAQPHYGSQSSEYITIDNKHNASCNNYQPQQHPQQLFHENVPPQSEAPIDAVLNDQFVMMPESAYSYNSSSSNNDDTDTDTDTDQFRRSCQRTLNDYYSSSSNSPSCYDYDPITPSSSSAQAQTQPRARAQPQPQYLVKREKNAQSALKYRTRAKRDRQHLGLELERQTERQHKLQRRMEQGLIVYQELLSMLTTSLKHNWTPELAEIAQRQLKRFRELAPHRHDLWGKFHDCWFVSGCSI